MRQTIYSIPWRLIGLLLIAAGVICNIGALSWLAGARHESLSLVASSTVLVLRTGLLVAGSAMLVRPAWFVRFDPLRTALIGTSLAALIVGAVGNFGASLASENRVLVSATLQFDCAVTDPFCNRARESGIANVPLYGRTAAFVDIDMDQKVDLFIANSDRRLPEDDGDVSWFYLNNGNGTYRPVRATELGIHEADLLSAWQASFADIDNDGDPDMAIANGGYTGESVLAIYENRMRETGTFLSITDSAGFRELNAQTARWWSTAWADYDNDGLLDLAVSRSSGPLHLFHNDGGNRFTDVTRAMAIATPNAWHRDGRNLVWFDSDNDGDQDLYGAGINNHMYYENLDGKVFRDKTVDAFARALLNEESGNDTFFLRSFNSAHDRSTPGVQSAAAADFNQDGYEDLYLVRHPRKDLVLLNDGKGRFLPSRQSAESDDSEMTRRTAAQDFAAGLIPATGLGIGDIDDDGWPDVVLSADGFFCNRSGILERCLDESSGLADEFHNTRSHGIAFGDANEDGASDMVLTFGGDHAIDRRYGIDSREPSALFVSNPSVERKTGRIMLEGTKSNRDALGARVRVITADATHYYTVRGAQGGTSQNELALIIPVADVADIEIRWPSGAVSEHQVRAGEHALLRE